MSRSKSSSTPAGQPLVDRFKLVINKASLPATVFLTGAAVLIVEIIATRILSPYFGNTIYTVSSVISVVLAALSCGYAIGGHLADRRPQTRLFYLIICLSGLMVLLLQALNRLVLPEIGFKLSLISGPIIISVLFLFLPSFLLGMLSPFAIKLQTMKSPKEGVGTASGSIFFWSTLGSIFGSLATGFILIPNFGLNAILLFVGSGLTILGLIPQLLARRSRLVLGAMIVWVVLVGISSGVRADVLYEHDGVYEKIVIYDGEYNDRPTRFFRQDHSSSGAMFLDGDDLVYDYTKYYSLYKLFQPDVKDALFIGGGAYSMPKMLLNELPEARIDVSEIEPSLYELSQKYFKLPPDNRLTNYTTDGRRLLEAKDKKYDYIFSDVYYSLFSIPTHFTTAEFFTRAKSRLNDQGIFVANLIGDLSREKDSFSLAEMKTFQQAFPNSYFFGVDSPAAGLTQNIIFVGFNSDKAIDFTSAAVTESPDQIIRNLPLQRIDPYRFELSDYPILTDDYAPVENMTAQMLIRSQHEGEIKLDGNRMMALIAQQLRYGSRALSASGHQKVQDFIEAELKAYLPKVARQPFDDSNGGANSKLVNIVGSYLPDKKQRVIVGAHYDSKRYASLDAQNPRGYMPGANDSGSGVAALLELARYLGLSSEPPEIGIDLVFFDGEEGYEELMNDFSNWQPLGSTYFASHLADFYDGPKPSGGVILDMICDKNLNIFQEANSLGYARDQTKRFWDIGRRIDSNAFIPKLNDDYGAVFDDHVPLSIAGIPSFVVIDYDYPPFHTTQDTLDKCSAKSLQIVADTLLEYISTIPD